VKAIITVILSMYCLPQHNLHCLLHCAVSVCLQPVLDEAALLQLGPAKYKVTVLPEGPQQQVNITRLQQQQQQLQAAAGNPAAAEQLREQHLIEQAVAAAAAFRDVAAAAAGMSTAAAQQQQQQQQQQQYGPWKPFMAPLLVNQRVTSADHFQDTRHIEFDLRGSGFDYQPGDLLAVFPRTPPADVQVRLLLLRCCFVCTLRFMY
jgi:sulfite reductase alpha subunit-like flavoprotein